MMIFHRPLSNLFQYSKVQLGSISSLYIFNEGVILTICNNVVVSNEWQPTSNTYFELWVTAYIGKAFYVFCIMGTHLEVGITISYQVAFLC